MANTGCPHSSTAKGGVPLSKNLFVYPWWRWFSPTMEMCVAGLSLVSLTSESRHLILLTLPVEGLQGAKALAKRQGVWSPPLTLLIVSSELAF